MHKACTMVHEGCGRLHKRWMRTVWEMHRDAQGWPGDAGGVPSRCVEDEWGCRRNARWCVRGEGGAQGFVRLQEGSGWTT